MNGKEEIIKDLESTIAKGGSEKVICSLKKRLDAVKSGKMIEKRVK